MEWERGRNGEHGFKITDNELFLGKVKVMRASGQKGEAR